MRGYVRNARIKIPIEGKQRPYTEGEWVVFTPAAFPIGFMHVEHKHVRKVASGMYEADPEKAFRDYWSWNPETTPLRAAMEGYRIELMDREKAFKLLDANLDSLRSLSDDTGEEETA